MLLNLEGMTPFRQKTAQNKKKRSERVENLPDDMNLDEFRNTGLDFGEAPHPKGPKGSEVSPCLHHSYGTSPVKEWWFFIGKNWR